MHWHTETQVGDLGTQYFRFDLTAADDPASEPDLGAVTAAYAAAGALAFAISAGEDAFVTLDRVRDPETTSQSITVTVTVP